MPASSAASQAIKIFFSYATSAPMDKRLFARLTAHLSTLKRQHLIDEWYDSDISAGSSVPQVIKTLMSASDIIVLLISADFYTSERCYAVEMKYALELAARGAARLIPVILHPFAWKPSPLEQYNPLPPNGKPITRWTNRDSALSEVAKGIRRVVEELAGLGKRPRTAPPELPLFSVPYRRNAFFTDRETALAALSSSFSSPPSLQTTIVALNGLPGIGKTHVALEYIYTHASRYQAILWLNAASRAVLSTEVSALADRLALPEQDRVDEQHLFNAVKRWLRHQSTWLLVLDQIEDVALVDLIVPPQSSGHVLLTTYQQATGGIASPIPIAQMGNDASVLLLLRRAGLLSSASIDEAPADAVLQARAIAQAVDGFPLALDQAGAYLEETGCGLAAYLKLYHDERAALLSLRGHIADDSHPASVFVTLSLAIEKICQRRTENGDLLRLLAFLHPDSIPVELLTQGASELHEPLQTLAAHPLQLHRALADLRSFSLLYHCADTTTLRIHRMVQIILAEALSTEQRQQWASLTVRLVNRVFPEPHFDNWTECERFLAQAQHCSTLITDYHLTLAEAPPLLERLGRYCYQRGCYSEAESYLVQSLRLHEYHAWTAPLETAQTMNSLGRLYHRLARYQEAEALHQRALALRERELGLDDPTTAESLHNLAVLHGDQGHYQQAEQFYLRVLSIDERAGRAENSETASTLNNLGMIYYLQGRYPQAEATYQRSLALHERLLSPNDPQITYTLNGLGALYETLGDYERAEKLYQRALAIREQSLGDTHPLTADSLNTLADVYGTLEKYQQAEALYNRALSIAEQVLGPEHPNTARYLHNLALLADTQQHYQKAEPLYQRSLLIYEQAFEPNHPFIATVLNNLGTLYMAIGSEKRAEALLRRALAIRQQVLGADHPDTAESLTSLADLLLDRQAYTEAEPLFQQALSIYTQAFGPAHPDVSSTRERYASLLDLMQRGDEAARLRQTAPPPQDQSSHESPPNDR